MNEIQGVILSMFLFWLHFKIIDLDNIFIQNLNGIGQQDKPKWYTLCVVYYFKLLIVLNFIIAGF